MTQTQSDFTAPVASTADWNDEPVEHRKTRMLTGDKVVGGVSHTILIIWSLLVVVPLL